MPKRKVDVFAGEGSFADKLRKRRIAIESGDPSGGRNQKDEKSKEKHPSNHPSGVLKRGYYVEKEE